MFGTIVLGAATLASAIYFAFAVWQRLRRLSAARPDLEWSNTPARLGRVLREVLLQQRVLAKRPLAGFLHALVMWGFLAFAWVSIEHFAQGFTGLENAQPGASWYDAFAGVWAVAVLVGIVGLAYRRFVLRPTALGKPSGGSTVVAALIVALMATYLADWLALEPPSAAWRWNWWAHTAALLGMLWVIPNSKHLHLLLGPVAIFFRRGDTISPTRALVDEDDDDFGLMRLGDLSQKDILDVNACVECGRCTDVCPANQSGGSLNPKEVILQLQRGLLSAPNLAEANAAGTAAEVAAGEAWVSEEDLYQCFACGACEQACPVGIEHLGPKILDLRRGLVSEGRTEHSKLNDLFQTMERSPHNGWGASQQVRRKLLGEAALPVFDGSQDWLLWMGCGCNYDPHGHDLIRSMQKLLNGAGLSWGVLSQETCCGEPARRAGNEYLAMELSEKVIDALSSAGAKNVVTCDPHCCRMLDVDYRQNERYEELGIRVVHHTELLEELLPRLTLAGVDEEVVYHDPCWLARPRRDQCASGDARSLRRGLTRTGLPRTRHGLLRGGRRAIVSGRRPQGMAGRPRQRPPPRPIDGHGRENGGGGVSVLPDHAQRRRRTGAGEQCANRGCSGASGLAVGVTTPGGIRRIMSVQVWGRPAKSVNASRAILVVAILLASAISSDEALAAHFSTGWAQSE